MTPYPAARSLTLLAWLNVALHVSGLVFAALALRPGSPLASLAERRAYLAAEPIGWTLGWGVWILCALGLISFLAVLTHRLEARPPAETFRLARLGLTIALVGVGFDLSCDAAFIFAFPRLAAEPFFPAVERVINFVSLVVANGAYSVGILFIVLDMQSRVSRLTTSVGYGVAVFGLLLAAAGVTGVPWHTYASGPAIGLFCVWVVLVARSLEPGSRP